MVQRRASGVRETQPRPQLSHPLAMKLWASHFSLSLPTGIAVWGWHELLRLKHVLTQSHVCSEDLLSVTAFPSHCGGLTIPNPEYRVSFWTPEWGLPRGPVGTEHTAWFNFHLLPFIWLILILIQFHCGQRTLRFQSFEIWVLFYDTGWSSSAYFHMHLKSKYTLPLGEVFYKNLLGQEGW